MTGVGGKGGESWRSAVVEAVILDSGLSREAESDEESEEDGVIFGRVALDSDPCFLISSESDSLPELEESESESGKGVFLASDCVEESESEEESEDDESLLDEEPLLEELVWFFLVFVFLSLELELELESESEEDESLLDDSVESSSELELELELESDDEEDEEDEEDPLLEDLEDFLTFLTILAFLEALGKALTSSELELDPDDDDDDDESLEDDGLTVFSFLAFGASSSELESDEESLLDDSALRFRTLTFGLGEAELTTGASFSSSASLSDPLDEEGEAASRAFCFLFDTIGVYRSN